MFSGLRLRLTLLYSLAALVVVGLVGGGAYLIVARYFWSVTDLALQHKMAHEFHALAAPIPASLAHADRDWSILRDELGWLPLATQRSEDGDDEGRDGAPGHVDQDGDHDDQSNAASAAQALAGDDSPELAAITVLPLDASGCLLFTPGEAAPIIRPDLDALQSALSRGSDLRTVTTTDGRQVRLLTYPLTGDSGPAALQLGRELCDQEQVLNQLTLGLFGLGTLSMAVVGAASWWLAGRALRPAEEAWERQQRFVASASRELRTPLTLIRASAEVALRTTLRDDRDQRELLGDVLAESDHMSRLVDDLLTLSRLDSGHLTLDTAPTELLPLLTEVQRQMARLGEHRAVAVQLAVVEGSVLADGERLHQVLLILLDNALRHTPAGGRVTISGTPYDQIVRVEVIDTGNGIAPEHLPHIFERFYRADPARGRAGGNAGLGLAIARGLVEAMGGAIRAESQLGSGATFWLTLPAAQQ